MIGYGIIMLVIGIFQRKDRNKRTIRRKLYYQMPLLILLVTFSTIFIKYNNQEYGKLRESYIVKANMSNIELKLNTGLKDAETTARVYKLPIADQEETLKYAKNFFGKLGQEIDESRIDIYDETVIYHTVDIESVELSYALDSKGFYQPVYDFKCKINGEKESLIIPAMKK
jgi:hypothetical protein